MNFANDPHTYYLSRVSAMPTLPKKCKSKRQHTFFYHEVKKIPPKNT